MSTLIDELRNVPPEKRSAMLNWFLQKKARASRSPISVYCELTPMCNLACKMCYSRLSTKEVQEAGGLCSVEQWKTWIKEAIELGALYVAFTGGECMTYPHFDELYKYAYCLGAKVIVMTNGALITPQKIEMFKEMPPDNISMTMYGFSRETYEKTCANGNAFQQVCRAVEMICDEKLPLQLKATVTRDMLSDLPSIYGYAKAKGAKFLSSNMLMTSREACNRECEKLAVEDDEYFAQLMKMYALDHEEKLVAPLIDTRRFGEPIAVGMQCGAGRSTFTINWRGEMLPCNVTDVYRVNLDNCSVKEAWSRVVDFANNVPQITECYNCIFQNRCRKCVFLHYSDMGEYNIPSPRICWKKKNSELAIEEERNFWKNFNSD